MTQTFFVTNSLGVGTNRDAWVYDSSKRNLVVNVNITLNYYNQCSFEYKNSINKDTKLFLKDKLDSSKIVWTASIQKDLERGLTHTYDSDRVYIAMYRPFFKQYLYFDRSLNHRVYRQLSFFPTKEKANIVICLAGVGRNKEYSLFISSYVSDLQLIANGQCFPLYWYEDIEEPKGKTADLFDEAPKENSERYVRRDGITDFALNTACQQYKTSDISKEDIFYYVYGFLHSEDYRSAFDADLKKMLARIPFVESYEDFRAFEKAGRELAHYHLNYEDIPAYSGVEVEYKKGKDEADYTVTKLRFAKKRVEGKSVNDRSTIIYNKHITIKNIPEEAYNYEVNGRSAIEWIIDRYQVRTDKKSGITNDPNDWGREHGNKRYILDLLLSVITVSMESVRIVKSLPKLDFEE